MMKRWTVVLAAAMALMALTLAGCGGGGGGSSTAPTPATSTVSGVAAAGAPLVGTVYLKDSATPAKELSGAIGTDGSFSFNVDGLKAPFILKAQGTIGSTNYTLYSYASGPGIGNINPFANLAVAYASDDADLAVLYATPVAATMQMIGSNLPQAVSSIQTHLQPILTLYNANANPVTDSYSANHLGLDGVFDTVSVTLVAVNVGRGFNITNKLTSAIICTGVVSNYTWSALNTQNIPQPLIVINSISGNITAGGSALAGVTVSTTGGSATTDASGNYSIIGLINGNYTVTPAKTGYAFTPVSQSVTLNGANATGKNFTAIATTASTYSISGNITAGGSALAGVSVSTSGGSATTDASGNYTISGLANGSYTVTPTKTGYALTPVSLTATVSGANLTGQNFTAASTAAVDYSISGTITAGGSALAGVTVSTNGGSATTDANGNYSIGLLTNGSYTVTSTKTGFTFTPVSQSVTVNGANATGKNFTATSTAATTYSISGNIFRAEGGALVGVTVSTGSGSTTTDASGNYSLNGLVNGSYIVTPTISGYASTPVSKSITVNGANVTGVNFATDAGSITVGW